ncbi:MAG: hypothetical protein ABIC40_06970, partial [bacterium]
LEISQEFLRYEILSVCQLDLSDSSPEIRNLSEFCSLGIVNLIPGESDNGKFLGLLDTTGRHRLLTDIEVSVGDSDFTVEETESLSVGLNQLAKKYGHIQRVRLVSIGNRESDKNREDATFGRFLTLARSCPKAIIAVSPELWISRVGLRESSNDLGCVAVFKNNEFEPVTDSPGKTDSLFSFALKEGIQIERLLPVSYSYYRKGWYSFEVGKVLDSWVDHKPFQYYKEPYAWL